MTQFSDAALLRGKFAHMAAELRQGKRDAPKHDDWQKVACDNSAEQAAQQVGKHVFAFQQSIDPDKETLEVIAMAPAGPMKVMAVFPGDGDILRIDGLLLSNGMPTSCLINVAQMSLSFTRRPIEHNETDDDGLQIGYVIFDELNERQKQRDLTKPAEQEAD